MNTKALPMDGSEPTLPADIAERAIYRRGSLAVYDRLDPRRTALLVVDMQNAWVEPGAPFDTPGTRAIVPVINRLAGALRSMGSRIVWLQQTAAAQGTPGYWSGYFDHHVAEAHRAAAVAALQPGTWTHAVSSRLDVKPVDLVLLKYRFSAFLGNPHDLSTVLSAFGIDTVVVVGTATNVGVESTVRDAMMRDLRVFMPHDAVVAYYYDAHVAAMRSIVQIFADVRPADDLIALARAGRRAP